MFHPVLWFLALAMLLGSGCGERTVAITTHQFTFRDEGAYNVTGFKEGYYNETVTLTADSDAIQAGVLKLVLLPDQCWTSTTLSQATNTWLRLPVDPGLGRETVWQKIIDAVTTRYDSLEQIDGASGYLRSSPRFKTFKVNGTTVSLRNQLYCAQASSEPLVYKLKVVSERCVAGGDWRPYGRIYKGDADLVNELMVRLGQAVPKQQQQRP